MHPISGLPYWLMYNTSLTLLSSQSLTMTSYPLQEKVQAAWHGTWDAPWSASIFISLHSCFINRKLLIISWRGGEKCCWLRLCLSSCYPLYLQSFLPSLPSAFHQTVLPGRSFIRFPRPLSITVFSFVSLLFVSFKTVSFLRIETMP